MRLQLVAKILETFSLIGAQTLSLWSYAFPPTPLIKVASDAKPYSKLQPTTLMWERGQCVFLFGGAFLLGGLLFSQSVSTILQLVEGLTLFNMSTYFTLFLLNATHLKLWLI